MPWLIRCFVAMNFYVFLRKTRNFVS